MVDTLLWTSRNGKGQSIIKTKLRHGAGEGGHLSPAPVCSAAIFQSLRPSHKLFPLSPNLCLISSLLFTSQLEGHLGSFWSPWCIPLPGHLRSLHPDPSSALIFTSACYAHLLSCIFRVTSLLVPELDTATITKYHRLGA